MHKEIGLPFAEGLDTVEDLPHTISYAIMYRVRIDSFNELPKDKRPPRDLWTKPWRLSNFLDSIWDTGKEKKDSKNKDMYEYNEEDVE